MWGTDEIGVSDVIQGSLGDCWMMASIGAISGMPKHVKEAFLVEEKTQVGVYAVKMYLLGSPITVTLDDFIPIDMYSDSTLYATVSEDGAIWSPILEKAMAKYLGNYEAMNGGFEKFAFQALLGAPFREHWTDEVSVEELWQILTSEDRNESLMTVGSFYSNGGDKYTNDVGLPYSHAFSVLDTVTVENNRLVLVRNPWGEESYFGKWSDQDILWTEEMKQKLSHVTKNDGLFYISIEDFHLYFESVTVASDVSQMHRTTYEVFGDDKARQKSRVFPDTHLKYNVYTFTLTTPVDQKVHISLKTYGDQQYLGECYETYLNSEVYIDSPTESSILQANPGSADLNPVQMQAGESLEISVYTRFGSTDMLPHDWALVTLGSGEKV